MKRIFFMNEIIVVAKSKNVIITPNILGAAFTSMYCAEKFIAKVKGEWV